MAVHRRSGFYQREHPVGRRARHLPYAADTEHPRGRFSVDPEIALLGKHQASVANSVQNSLTRMIDGHYCILTPRDVAGISRDFDILLICRIAISLEC